MKKYQYKISNSQLAILNEKHTEKLSFKGCDEWMKIGGSHPMGKDTLFSSMLIDKC
jgi:hypothetical protein